MDLSKILSISGKPGLFRIVSQTKTGALVESLIDGKRIPTFVKDRISSLEDISIFTTDEDTPLQIVLQSIYRKENGGQTISPKSSTKDLLAYMEEILPNFDQERVYTSDIKKLLSWYNLLNEKQLIDLEEKKEVEETTEEN